MVSNAASFYAEARFQRACAHCGTVGGPFEAHHLIKKQRLRRHGLPLHDTRGAVRLCEGLQSNHCHFKIEKGGERLETSKLSQQAICYVWEALGMAGQNMLELDYTGVERRFTLHSGGGCPHCQHPS